MALAMPVAPIAPRPSPHVVPHWQAPPPPPHQTPRAQQPYMDGKENRPALRQIRQQSGTSRPTPPRSKRERPCDGCRRRKSKCVLQESRKCVLCEFHKQECTFVENAQPRKRKLDDSGSTKENASKKAASSTGTSTAASSPRQQTRVQAATSRVAMPPANLPLNLPFEVDTTLSLQRHRHCKYLGQTTALDASLIGLGSLDEKHETNSSVGTLRQVIDGEYFSTHADASVPIPDDEARALAEIDAAVGVWGEKLIEIYFRNLHPSFPIIQKRAFLDRHKNGDRQFNPPLLAAMYLLALQWWDMDPALNQHPKPDVAKLEYIAITSLTISMQRPKISAVQAGLLLLQRSKSNTWTLTVQLVALGQDIGLHLDCSEWNLPLWERRLRKKLAWALYMQDKWSALMHGRPSHINAVDWSVPPPTPEDFDETTTTTESSSITETDVDPETLRGRTLFMQMISLTTIMADVTGTFYSQTAKAEYARAGRYATQLVLNRAKPVQIKLKDWFSKLPAECKMDAYSPHTLSATGYLHLGYFATEISIHRRIVQSLDPASTDPYMLYICRSAAKTRLISALDFANRLRPEHLNAFWYFPSASNFALIGTFGALLMATSPGADEAQFYEARLREYLWTLTMSAEKAGWMASAVELVRANGEMLAHLPEKPREVEGNSRGAAPAAVPVGMGVGAGWEGGLGGEQSGFRGLNGIAIPHELDEESVMEADGWDEEGSFDE